MLILAGKAVTLSKYTLVIFSYLASIVIALISTNLHNSRIFEGFVNLLFHKIEFSNSTITIS